MLQYDYRLITIYIVIEQVEVYMKTNSELIQEGRKLLEESQEREQIKLTRWDI